MVTIKSFEDKETRKLFMDRKSKAVSEQAYRKALRKLEQLDSVESVEEMAIPLQTGYTSSPGTVKGSGP